MKIIMLPGACLALLALAGCADTATQAPVPRPQSQLVPAAGTMTAQDEASLYLNVIDGLIKQERYGAALAFLDGYAVKQKNLEPRYWLLRGDAFLGLNRPAEAQPCFARLADTSLTAEGWNGLGRVASMRFIWREAAIHFQKAVQASPANADFLNNLAFASLHIGQSGAAVMQLRQAHELNPDSPLIRNNLAIALTLSGSPADAAAILGKIPDAAQRQEAAAIVRAATAKLAQETRS